MAFAGAFGTWDFPWDPSTHQGLLDCLQREAERDQRYSVSVRIWAYRAADNALEEVASIIPEAGVSPDVDGSRIVWHAPGGPWGSILRLATRDGDDDGVLDPDDDCPDVANLDQADADGDGSGDACDPATLRERRDRAGRGMRRRESHEWRRLFRRLSRRAPGL